MKGPKEIYRFASDTFSEISFEVMEESFIDDSKEDVINTVYQQSLHLHRPGPSIRRLTGLLGMPACLTCDLREDHLAVGWPSLWCGQLREWGSHSAWALDALIVLSCVWYSATPLSIQCR